MKFEAILEETGGFGRFQIFTIMLLCSHRLSMPMHFLLNVFIGALPAHRCDISTLGDGGLFQNLTHEQRLAVSIPAGDDGNLKSCEMFAEPQFQLLSNGTNGTKPPTVQCPSGWVYDRATFTSTVATEWNLTCERKNLSKAVSSIFFSGVMIGSLIFGYLCDKFGRRNSLLVSYVMTLILGISSAFANSYAMFAVLRFLTGFAISGTAITAGVLAMEWVDKGYRSLAGVMVGLSWAVGNMLLAAVAYLVNDWRMLMIAVTAPMGFSLLTWWWLPESARWLLANGKRDEALFYLDRCAHINKTPNMSSQYKLKTLSTVEMDESEKQNYSYLHLFKTPKMRKLSLITGIVWFGVAVTYYGISMSIFKFGYNVYITHFIYAAIEVPAKLAVIFLHKVIGRKKCQGGTLLVTGLCLAVNIFIPKGLGHVRVVVSTIGKGFSEASFTAVGLYTTELFPTVIRQNGVGYANFMARVGVTVAPLILLLEDVWNLLPQTIFCCAAVACGLVSLLLPETLNKRLGETIEDIENPKSGI